MVINGKKKLLIIGAGCAGQLVLNEIKNHSTLNKKYEITGFIDDDPQKINTKVNSFKILGNQSQLEDIVKKHKVTNIIISIPSATGNQIRKIIDRCINLKVEIKIVPGIFEIIKGDVFWHQIRNFKLEDLLGREEVEFDASYWSRFFQDKNVLITGAGGSIGESLTKKLLLVNPAKLFLIGRGENSIFKLLQDIKPHKTTQIIPIIANIQDKLRLDHILRQNHIHYLFHTAAHKHVSFMEQNPTEAVNNNIIATINLADLSIKHNVERFIFISTDKAVYPTSIMGISKRICEIFLLSLAYKNKKKSNTPNFYIVRFGNVLGSRGSVIKIFQNQINKGGPITITHPEAERFFMSIAEAAKLLVMVSTMDNKNSMYLLDMGQSIKIKDLALNMIHLSGLKEDSDIKIEFTKLGEGEKIKEKLVIENENFQPASISNILICKNLNTNFNLSIFKKRINRLRKKIKYKPEKAKIELKKFLKYY